MRDQDRVWGWGRKADALSRVAHLSDDSAVAKMGHGESDQRETPPQGREAVLEMGHPSDWEYSLGGYGFALHFFGDVVGDKGVYGGLELAFHDHG